MKAIRYKENSIQREYFAIKCTEQEYVNTKNETLNRRRWECIKREKKILERLDNPHVIKFIEFINGKKYFYLVSELANGGTLKDLID